MEGRGAEEGRRQFRGTITMSAIALISSSQLIRVSLLLPEALEMLIRTPVHLWY